MVLTGLGVFWGVLTSSHYQPPTNQSAPSIHLTLTKKARHSPPQKVCTENLTNSPKHDNIKAVLVEINRTERRVQAPRKENKETKKERKENQDEDELESKPSHKGSNQTDE